MKRKNKSVRKSARSQPLPTAANAGEVAFAPRYFASRCGGRCCGKPAVRTDHLHCARRCDRRRCISGGSRAAGARSCRQCAGGARTAVKAKILHRLADRSVLRRRCAGGGHRILPVLRLVSGRFSRCPGGMLPLRGVFCANSGCQRLPKVLE